MVCSSNCNHKEYPISCKHSTAKMCLMWCLVVYFVTQMAQCCKPFIWAAFLSIDTHARTHTPCIKAIVHFNCIDFNSKQVKRFRTIADEIFIPYGERKEKGTRLFFLLSLTVTWFRSSLWPSHSSTSSQKSFIRTNRRQAKDRERDTWGESTV